MMTISSNLCLLALGFRMLHRAVKGTIDNLFNWYVFFQFNSAFSSPCGHHCIHSPITPIETQTLRVLRCCCAFVCRFSPNFHRTIRALFAHQHPNIAWTNRHILSLSDDTHNDTHTHIESNIYPICMQTTWPCASHGISNNATTHKPPTRSSAMLARAHRLNDTDIRDTHRPGAHTIAGSNHPLLYYNQPTPLSRVFAFRGCVVRT